MVIDGTTINQFKDSATNIQFVFTQACSGLQLFIAIQKRLYYIEVH